MSSARNSLFSLQNTPEQRQAVALYEALAEAQPLPPTAERALQHTLNLLIQSWRMAEDGLPAVLFFARATDTPTPWQALGSSVVLSPRTAALVQGWHELNRLTAVTGTDAAASRSLKLRRLMRLGYLDMPLVLLTIAEHYGRVITAVEKGQQAPHDPTLWDEAHDIYIPLLASLGLWNMRDSYITYAYERLQPGDYLHATERLHQAQQWHQQTFSHIQHKLRQQSDKYDFNFYTRHHYITPGKLIFTQHRTGRSIDEQLNRVVIDVITDKRQHCYRLLDLVHRLGSPHRRRFHDYIANPLLNGYQALQTRIEWTSPSDKRALTVDFRIQTNRMNWLNEHGIIAATYRFPHLYQGNKTWWNTLRLDEKIQRILADYPVADHAVGDDKIYVFTPKGEVRILRNGSTAVDFAYDLHTEMGHQCRAIDINGATATHGTRLQNGDLVGLHIDPAYNGPQPDWLHAARRPSTIRAIKNALNGANASASEGRQRLDRYLQALEQESGLVIPSPRLDSYLTQLAQEIGLGQANHLLDVLTRTNSRQQHSLTEERVISYILERELVGSILYPNGKPLIEVDGLHRETTYRQPLVRFCPTCKPAPGASLLLYRRRKGNREYLTLHRTAGTNQRHFGLPHGDQTTCTQSLARNTKGTIVEGLMWSDTAVGHQLFNITVVTADRSGLIGDLLVPIYDDDGINLTSLNAQGDTEHTATVLLTVDCESWDKGTQLKQALRDIVPLAQISLIPLSAPQATAGRGRLQNPYSTGVPISSRLMFFGREQEIQAIKHELDKEDPARLIVMHGHRRTGKTSLAHMQATIWRGYPLLPIYVDLQNLSEPSPTAVYRAMALRVQETTSTQLTAVDIPSAPSRAAFEEAPDPYELLQTYLHQITAVVKPHRLLIMLDEFNILLEKRPYSPIFKQLRGLTNDPYLTAVTLMPIMHTAQYNDRQRFDATSPARILWEQGVELHIARLDTHSARRLVTEPMQGHLNFAESVVNEIIRGTNGNPYLIHIICRHLVEHLDRTRRTFVRPVDLQHVLANHIYPAAHTYFNFLVHHIAEFPSSLEVTLAIAEAQHGREDWLSVEEIWHSCRRIMPARRFFEESLFHLQLYGVVNLRGHTADGLPQQLHIPVGFFRTWVADQPDALRALVERRNHT